MFLFFSFTAQSLTLSNPCPAGRKHAPPNVPQPLVRGTTAAAGAVRDSGVPGTPGTPSAPAAAGGAPTHDDHDRAAAGVACHQG